MRLKEITPGMVIHCKNYDEKKALLEEAERLGYLWHGTRMKPTENMNVGNTIHFYDAGKSYSSSDYKNITHSEHTGENVTEFSDLILYDLKAEEVLNTIKEICESNNTCNDMCLLCDSKGCVIRKTEFDVKKVIEICAQWKSDHEKKEPEIEEEWMWLGCIMSTNTTEQLQYFDTSCESKESAKEYMAGKLKEYCKTHDGEYMAKVERVCRVKAVE